MKILLSKMCHLKFWLNEHEYVTRAKSLSITLWSYSLFYFIVTTFIILIEFNGMLSLPSSSSFFNHWYTYEYHLYLFFEWLCTVIHSNVIAHAKPNWFFLCFFLIWCQSIWDLRSRFYYKTHNIITIFKRKCLTRTQWTQHAILYRCVEIHIVYHLST